MNWYSADHHLNHFNILRFCNRPFHTLDEMHKTMIENWNAVVRKNDIVYYLGDFCFESKKEKVIKWREKFNGRIILVTGNHDHKVTRKVFRPDCYDELPLKIGKYNCILTHRPLYPDYWDIPARDITNHFARRDKYKQYNFIISAHIHDLRTWTGRSLNVGVDVHDFTPVSEAKVIDLLNNFQK